MLVFSKPSKQWLFNIILAGTLFSITSVTQGDTQSAAKKESFRVNLIATVDNSPAMREVNWTVYRVGDDSVTTFAKNHSTHVNIPPGKYRVVATLKKNNQEVTRERKFYVQTNSQVVVPMD